MDDSVLRIERMENGFEVEIYDQKAAEANAKPKSTYESPWKSYAFTTTADVVKFVAKHLNTLPKSAGDEFNEAAAEAFEE